MSGRIFSIGHGGRSLDTLVVQLRHSLEALRPRDRALPRHRSVEAAADSGEVPIADEREHRGHGRAPVRSRRRRALLPPRRVRVASGSGRRAAHVSLNFNCRSQRRAGECPSLTSGCSAHRGSGGLTWPRRRAA